MKQCNDNTCGETPENGKLGRPEATNTGKVGCGRTEAESQSGAGQEP